MQTSKDRNDDRREADRVLRNGDKRISLRRILEIVLPFLALCAAIWLLRKLAELVPA